MTSRILAGLLCAAALPALAQDAPADWDLFRDPAKRMIMAYTDFDNGLGVAVRCVNRSYEAIITGLPEAEAETRTLSLRFTRDDMEHDQTWNVAVNPRTAVSSFPARFARQLREGGALNIVVPGGAGDGRNLRYVLDLPASNAAIDETLNACRRPVIDPRDAEIEDIGQAGLPGGVSWAQAPRPRYPETNYVKGFAVVTCLNNSDGSLRDCVVETEHPQDGGFGEEALRATRRARISSTANPSAPVPNRFISYRTNFYLEGYEPRRRPAGRAPAGG